MINHPVPSEIIVVFGYIPIEPVDISIEDAPSIVSLPSGDIVKMLLVWFLMS